MSRVPPVPPFSGPTVVEQSSFSLAGRTGDENRVTVDERFMENEERRFGGLVRVPYWKIPLSFIDGHKR